MIEQVEQYATPQSGDGDWFSGYGVIGIPFRSGHILALRRFAVSTIGPGYTSVWHRGPSGDWTFYSTIAPDLACARYFGRQIRRNVVSNIDIEWLDSMRLRVLVGTRIEWDITLRSSLPTRVLNAFAQAVPEPWWQVPRVLRMMGKMAGAVLGAGRINLTGRTPNNQRFAATARVLWSIASTRAVLDGADLGPAGPVAEQASLGDFLIPQRGLFAIATTSVSLAAGVE
jgi:hypothetical protein